MSKKTFYTQFNPPPSVAQDFSKQTRPLYIPERQEDGTVELVQHGEENIYSLIQSHADECNLELLLQKCAARGDYSLLEQRKPVYGDLCGSPRDLTDAQNRLLLAKKKFDHLPSDVRTCFDGFDDFVRQSSTGKFSDKVIQKFTLVESASDVVKDVE